MTASAVTSDQTPAPAVPVPATAEPVSYRKPVFHPLRVSRIDRLTDDAVQITFDVPERLRDDFDFLPGQHLTVLCPQVGDTVRRNYSVCSPAGSGRLSIGVKRLPGGAFSNHALERLRVGDTLEVMTPTGRFHTRPDPTASRRYLAVAAGSGITPILSIIASTLRAEPSSRFTLLYGNRTVGSIMFVEELADLKDRYPDRFTLVHVLSREAHEVELFHGRIDADRLTRLLDVLAPPETVDEWFLCGPLGLVEQSRSALARLGVSADSVHFELFHVGGKPTPVVEAPAAATDADTSAVTVLLDGRSSTFPLATDGSNILDATLRVRADAPYACKGGVCGTCRARLVSGEVRMDQNYALEPDEIAAGFVLACQSHPVSDRVTLSFDG